MTRVSLKEAYDNKDVVAQIYAIRDIAEGAEDTADSAVTTANTASAHVDALVPQVEGAVQNANNASASAQTSAQTVAGYENRLSAVEGETAGLDSDLGAVELRVTTAEGQIVTIQGRVTALETADGQNVKLTGTQTIGGVKHFANPPTAPTTETGLWDVQVANGQKVKNELDNYSPMVRTTGNQDIAGTKTFTQNIVGRASGDYIGNVGGEIANNHVDFVEGMVVKVNLNTGFKFRIQGSANNNNYIDAEYAFVFSRQGTDPALYCIKKKYSYVNVEPMVYFNVDSDNNTVTFYFRKTQYTSQHVYIMEYFTYGAYYNPSEANKVKLSTNAGTIVTLPQTAIAEVVL